MHKKAWCRCKIVVLVIKPTDFLTSSLPSSSLDLKVHIVSVVTVHKPLFIGHKLWRNKFMGRFDWSKVRNDTNAILKHCAPSKESDRLQDHSTPLTMVKPQLPYHFCFAFVVMFLLSDHRGGCRGRVHVGCGPPPLKWPVAFWYNWHSAKKKILCGLFVLK